jgi:protein-tyrosine phosphatase
MLRPVEEVLAKEYGGKRAFARSMLCSVNAALGCYSRFRDIEWRRVRRVIFVCKGNICRSPYAEHRLRQTFPSVLSAGLAADPGKPADPRARLISLERDVDLESHRSRHLSSVAVKSADLLVTFEPPHATALARTASLAEGAQVTLLGLFGGSGNLVYLHDPYGARPEYFRRCYERIDSSLEDISRKLKRNNAG